MNRRLKRDFNYIPNEFGDQMTTKTFNQNLLHQNDANWVAAKRVVASFAPHEQSTPNMTIGLEQGFLLNGTVLTEVNAQNTPLITRPTSAQRIDRVVIDRFTGVASVVTGVEGAGSPPAIPTGKLPVARVELLQTSTSITNDMIVDERALQDLSPQTSSSIVCRAHLNGVNQTGIPYNVPTKVMFNTTDFNLGNSFDVVNKKFTPNLSGYYLFYTQGSMIVSANGTLEMYIYKNGTVTSFSSAQASSGTAVYTTNQNILYMNGSTDYVEIYCTTSNLGTNSLVGNPIITYFTATRLG